MLQALATVARTACVREIGGAGRPLALPEIHRYAHAAVALVFQGLHLAQAHADRQARILADRGFGLRGAARPGFLERPLDNGLQVRLGEPCWGMG